MRKRNIRIQLWLNKKETEALDKKVKRSGLSREVYLRHLISGVIPREAPPPDYYAMMRELYRVGNTLEQLNKSTPTQEHNAAVLAAETAVREITKAVVLPQPVGK